MPDPLAENLVLTPTAAPADVAETPAVDQSAEADKNLGDIYDKLMASDEGGRDESGRFKSAVAKPDPAVSDQPGPEAAKETPALSDRAAQAAGLPANWTPDMADVWAAVPEASREKLHKWSMGLHAKMSEQGRAIASYKEVDPLFADINQNYAHLLTGKDGAPTTPAGALGYLLNIQKGMDKDALGTWMQVAERYNLIPQLVQRFTKAGQTADGQPAAAPAPDLSKLLKDIEARVMEQVSPQHIEQQVTRVMTRAETQQAVSRFAQEKPLWADVEATIPTFIEMARVQQPDAAPLALLEVAYDAAVHANPATRAKASDAALKAASLPTNGDRVAAAKKANQLNVKSTTAKTKPLSEEEAMGAAWDRVMSAA
jgi:hypothetical protein